MILKDFEFYEGRSIVWFGGMIFVDEFECGYNGEYCIEFIGKILILIVELFYVCVYDYEIVYKKFVKN